MEERITELEIRYTHQEAFIKQLSGVLFEQQRTIERLETRLGQVEGRIAEGGESAGPIPNDPPPHY